MSREIYTYTDLARIGESKLFSEIKYFPQVTVSGDLRKGLIGTMDRDYVTGIFSGDKAMHVTEFHNLAHALYEGWESDQSKFSETVILSEYLRLRIEAEKDDKKQFQWLLGCMRNLSFMLSSIILMEKAEIRPDDIETDGDRNLELLVDAWKHLAERDPAIQAYRNCLSKGYTKDNFAPILKKAFQAEYAFEDEEAIVFHGFYYITPQQEKTMCLLEDAGYKLIYLIPYDERYPFVYEIWDETYSEEKGYPPKSSWHIERSRNEDAYGEIFEGKKEVFVNNDLKIREYSSVTEFVNAVKHIKKDGYSLYSPGSKAINDILRDYYPDDYGERKILSYPIGQFVSVLNRMWDDDRKTIILDEESLIECFSSGWLSSGGISGRRYLQDLFYVLPFFAGCRTADEWERRIKKLKEIRENAINPFMADLDADESIARWQEAIGNPLANFSMFAVEPEKLDVILTLIHQILDMATELFGKEKEIQISDHICKLDRILSRHEVSSEMYEEEREKVKDIFDKLSQPSDFDAKCSPADIANALNLFINGRFEDGEVQSEKVGLVYPIYFVDAACIKNNSKVHICMCDVNTMPGGNKEYVWPLTSSVMRDCYKKTNNPLIVNLMQIMESTAKCNRYFMYAALKNKDVTISWVSSMGEKLLAPSPYVKLICDATGKNITLPSRGTITFSRVAESAFGIGKIEEYDNDRAPSRMIKEAKMAYALCPMKYILGYVVEKYPTYQSEFQQNYALNAFISAMYGLMKDKGMTVDQIYKNVMDLFPGMREVEKRQVYDYISYEGSEDEMNYGSRTECGEYYYTDERLKIHYPNQEVRDVAIGRYGTLLTPDGRKGMNLYEPMRANNEEEMKGKKDIVQTVCMFCPHIDYCRNAIFYGDQENYYD